MKVPICTGFASPSFPFTLFYLISFWTLHTRLLVPYSCWRRVWYTRNAANT